MPLQTALTQRLGLSHPIIQAPMAGGTTTVDLVAAVCEAGPLGFIGAAYLTPRQITDMSRAFRARTARPFGNNPSAPPPPPPMPLQTALTQRLGLSHPIIQAPMAGGTTTVDLVAAVCEAGALGFIGAAYLTPRQITDMSRALRARTARPFGINLFAPLSAPHMPEDGSPALDRLAPYHR